MVGPSSLELALPLRGTLPATTTDESERHSRDGISSTHGREIAREEDARKEGPLLNRPVASYRGLSTMRSGGKELRTRNAEPRSWAIRQGQPLPQPLCPRRRAGRLRRLH
jgi:hypothetical protein